MPGDYIVAVDIPDDPVDGGRCTRPPPRRTSTSSTATATCRRRTSARSRPPRPPTRPARRPPNSHPPSQPPSQQAGIISPCAGALHTVDVTDTRFLDGGGSPFQGQDRPSCEDKLVTVRAGQATAPNFNLFTDVPIPTHFWGLTLNDLGLTHDKRSVNYGEALGIPFVPVGLYDWAGRLVDTVHTDFNGIYEALEPSTVDVQLPGARRSLPEHVPLRRQRPGQPGAPNADYNPRVPHHRDDLPGLARSLHRDRRGPHPGRQRRSWRPTPRPPTRPSATSVPTSRSCYAVDRPFVRHRRRAANRKVTISGVRLRRAPPDGSRSEARRSRPTSWTDQQITLTVPGSTPAGAQALQAHRGRRPPGRTTA